MNSIASSIGITSANLKNADCNTVAAALRNKLGARGGGKPVMVQGSVKAAKSEIEEVLKEVL